MITISTCRRLTIALLLTCAAAFAQIQQAGKLQVPGQAGEAPLVRVDGRPFVDLEALTQMTGGSFHCDAETCVLSPSRLGDAASVDSNTDRSGFSRPFMAAAIEALASMRDWDNAVVLSIRYSFPLGASANSYRANAEERVRLAAVAVFTADDVRGLELLENQFNNVRAWSHQLIEAQKSLDTADLSMSGGAFQEDATFQGLVQCSRRLAEMLVSGSLQDAPECRGPA
jgi:hypothetical protein